MKIFVEKIRMEKQMSVRELSRRSGVSASHIHDIERGEKIPGIEVLCKLARALEVVCYELYDCDYD